MMFSLNTLMRLWLLWTILFTLLVFIILLSLYGVPIDQWLLKLVPYPIMEYFLNTFT
jgi:hypothetical protein